MKLLELFSGTKSMSDVFENRGHATFTVDNQRSLQPDLCANILELTADDLPDSEVIWASPPCQTFSVASISHHWKGGWRAYEPKTEASELGLAILDKTVELISQKKPGVWFIENPRGVMRKLIGGIFDKYGVNYHRHTVTYCQYGDSRMKPTDIWTNSSTWEPKPMCKNGAPCHERAPRGARTGTQGLKNARERGRIPADLCNEVADACEKNFNK